MGCRTGPGLPCPAGCLSSLLPALGHLACSTATVIGPMAAGRTKGPEHCSPRSLPSVVTVTWAPWPSFPCPPPSPLPSAQGPNNMWVCEGIRGWVRSRFENFVEIQKLPRKHEPGVVRCLLSSKACWSGEEGTQGATCAPEPQVRGQTHTPWGGFRSLGLRVVPMQHLMRRGAETPASGWGLGGAPLYLDTTLDRTLFCHSGLGGSGLEGERIRHPQQQGWIGPGSVPNPSYIQAPSGPP